MDSKQLIALIVMIVIIAVIVWRNWDSIAHRGKTTTKK
jgi:hypothetical protein